LRSPLESRLSLTKFITIIVIAASLEALVMVFKTSRTSIPEAIYPAALFAASMAALVSLGAYQWLPSRIAPPSPQEQRDAQESSRRAGLKPKPRQKFVWVLYSCPLCGTDRPPIGGPG
jgi:hypothetical protein